MSRDLGIMKVFGMCDLVRHNRLADFDPVLHTKNG